VSNSLPHDLNAERVLIASCLNQNKEHINEIITEITEDDFFGSVNKKIIKIVYSLYSDSSTIDNILINNRLQKEDDYLKAGGIDHLDSIKNKFYKTHIEDFIKLIKDLSIKRTRIKILAESQLALLDGKEDADEIVARNDAKLFLLNSQDKKNGLQKACEIVDIGLKQSYLHHLSGKQYTGIRTYWSDFDNFTSGFQPTDQVIIAASSSSGKALANGEPVLTIDGWKPVETLTLEDQIIGSDGKPYKLLGIFPQGIKNIYLVTLSDGSSVKVSGDHLWFTQDKKERSLKIRGSVKTTIQVSKTLKTVQQKPGNSHSIPYVRPIEFSKKQLKIHPYLMGALLGNGCFRKSTIHIHNPERDIIEKLSQYLPKNDYIEKTNYPSGKAKCLTFLIRNKKFGQSSDITKALIDYNLSNKLSYEKEIPNCYLMSSIEDRLLLLQGLLDTDGYVASRTKGKYKFSPIEFSTTSYKMAEQVKFLVQSLGGRCVIGKRMGSYKKHGKIIYTRENYRVGISFLNEIIPVSSEKNITKYLKDKNLKRDRYIQSIEKIEDGECTCIAIDSPDHLFVTKDFILTHNTSIATSIICNLLRYEPEKVSVIFTLEMSKEQILNRIYADLAGVNSVNIRNGWMAIPEWVRVNHAKRIVAASNLHIDETPAIQPIAMYAKLQKLMITGIKPDLVIADYVQLMTPDSKQGNRNLEVASIANTTKTYAKELKAPFIMLSQLSRPQNGGGNRRPDVNQLRDSGVLLEACDILGLLYRDEMTQKTDDNVGKATLILGKNRNGPSGDDVNLCFIKPFTRFLGIAKQI